MPRGKILNAEEKTKITAYHDAGYSTYKIAARIGRSQTVVQNFLKLGDSYGKIAKHNHNKKLTLRQKMLILHEARQNHLFSEQIAAKLNLPVTGRRVRQILSSDENFVFRKRAKKPHLTAVHKDRRLCFAKEHMSWNMEWRNVLFTDEKKFNLDGPDGFQFYWHDKRLKEEVRISRVTGGGGVMIWAGFCFNGKTDIAWLPPKMDSSKYIELMEIGMVDKAEELCGADFIYQRDNAPIHTSQRVKQWFRDKDIQVLDWPARSPDLNPIENLWGILARRIYANGRQFENISDLKIAIREQWAAIQVSELKNLVQSMPNRIFEVIRNNGGLTKY